MKAQDEAARLARLWQNERALWDRGIVHVAGVDEVGRGPLAGPVIAAAVILPADAHLPGINDSKRLTARRREQLSGEILRQAVAVALGVCEVHEIDRLNILRASHEAMRRALSGLSLVPEHALVDGLWVPDLGVEQTAIVGGDGLSQSIAAASIVAKVERDGRMRELAQAHPGYGFERHVGYPTREHLSALEKLGPCAIHRRSFAPVRRALARHGMCDQPKGCREHEHDDGEAYAMPHGCGSAIGGAPVEVCDVDQARSGKQEHAAPIERVQR